MMNNITYRKIRRADYEQIQEIINQSFVLYKYVEHPKVLKSLLQLYLQSCLAEQTFNCVAEKDGKVIGVIMGQAKSEYRFSAHLVPILATVFYTLKTNVLAYIYKCSTQDYKGIHEIYDKFLLGRKQEFDGVLTLFAVSEESRGLGVGKTLLHHLLKHLKKKNTHNIYLFTDSSCNYGFYERQGFERLCEERMSITSEKKRATLDVYLYGYKL